MGRLRRVDNRVIVFRTKGGLDGFPANLLLGKTRTGHDHCSFPDAPVE